jgi:chemotaxis methyl-accepting protein methylase
MAGNRSRGVFSRICRRCLGSYLFRAGKIWNHVPDSLRLLSPGRAYGRHLHAVARLHAERKQFFATFFLRNRAELELMRRLLGQKSVGSTINIAVLACSKGAEVYSVLWALHSTRPDLKFRIHAIDISQEILNFARKGVYWFDRRDVSTGKVDTDVANQNDLALNTSKDQNAPVFGRMTSDELESMFEIEGNQAKVRSWLKEQITWLRGDAGDPALASVLGPQDIVLANRFLCHMDVNAAEKCLRNIARLVKPGGYLFVSGIDLNVRTKVARDLGWKPVPDLIRDIHEGDPSLRQGWPLQYWGLEPFWDDRSDWSIRYASVFQIGEASSGHVKQSSSGGDELHRVTPPALTQRVATRCVL